MELSSDSCTELKLKARVMKFNPIIYMEVVVIGFLLRSLEARDKYIKIEKVTSCVKAENLAIQIITSETNPDFKKNIVYLNSTIVVRKKLQGRIQVRTSLDHLDPNFQTFFDLDGDDPEPMHVKGQQVLCLHNHHL